MDTSDDPVTATIIAVGATAASTAISLANKPDTPNIPVEQDKEVARQAQSASLSEREKDRRKLAASSLTKNWLSEPILSKPAMLGV